MPVRSLGLLSLIGLFFSLLSCGNQSQPHQSPTPSPAPDSAAVADVIHGFYQWYDAFIENGGEKSGFTKEENGHLALDSVAFETYFAQFQETGFVSEEFVQNEWAFFKKCAAFWQNESLGELPTCLDADKYFCAQDWDIQFWTTAPVRINPLGDNRMAATLYGGESEERNFELKKEGDKWVLTKIECDMGMEE
ncbi:MAG: hypothetical protein KIPDCIKN_00413 [Haliscomenobacter sp.]|jgi:hypothetical protein|nr:hypothetical protein [Haliscomenobacter sp.]